MVSIRSHLAKGQVAPFHHGLASLLLTRQPNVPAKPWKMTKP